MDIARGGRRAASFTLLLAALAPGCSSIQDGNDGGGGNDGSAADVQASDARDATATDVRGTDVDVVRTDVRMTDATRMDAPTGTDVVMNTDTGPSCGAGEMACGAPPVCTPVATDNANCGNCGHQCSSSEQCTGGQCVSTCTGMICGGTCIDTQSDSNHCGNCTTVCAATESCSRGACVAGIVCPPAPSGVSANAAAAYDLENQLRAAMGITCARMDINANRGAENHCNYYAANRGTSCTASPHEEVSTCSMFTGMEFWDRMSAAGYAGSPAFEDMHFMGDGAGAVQGWVDSVFHRTPVLNPWIADIGYGSASGCDTMDFGNGSGAPSDVVAVYPYANQTGVPTSFYGNEGPQPPAPPGGYPSGYPIHVFIQGSVTEHVLTLEGSTTPIAHQYLDQNDPSFGPFLRNTAVLYANSPLTAGTRYHVHIAGNNGAPVTMDWTFTTQ